RALFREDKVDLLPEDEEFMSALNKNPRLSSFGDVRQGIAENPSQINTKTNKRFGDRWKVGEGVFALTPDEAEQLRLSGAEEAILKPYFDLSDLGRYYIAKEPSRRLIYSTRSTVPNIEAVPALRRHLQRFRPIMDKRRETKNGVIAWWQLHWPREQRLWE